MSARTVTTTHQWPIGSFRHKLADSVNKELFVSNEFSLNGKSSAKFLMSLVRGTAGYHDLYLTCIGLGRNQKVQLNVQGSIQKSCGTISERGDEKTLMFDKSGSTHLVGSYLTSGMTGVSYKNLSIYTQIKHEVPIDKFDDELTELTDRSEFAKNILELADLTIRVEGKELKANKVILMGYSEVFKQMFSHPNSMEAKISVIEMEKAKAEVIEALIRWIYQAKVENLNEIAVDLYRTADKYQIGLLKKVCAKTMTKQLSGENVASRLILAYEHNEEELKQRILDFLADDKRNVKSLMASAEWLKYGVEYPEQVKKILDDIYA